MPAKDRPVVFPVMELNYAEIEIRLMRHLQEQITVSEPSSFEAFLHPCLLSVSEEVLIRGGK